MPNEISLIVVALSFAVTFIAARFLGKEWRARRRRRAEAAARVGETRQVRRARERRLRK